MPATFLHPVNTPSIHVTHSPLLDQPLVGPPSQTSKLWKSKLLLGWAEKGQVHRVRVFVFPAGLCWTQGAKEPMICRIGVLSAFWSCFPCSPCFPPLWGGRSFWNCTSLRNPTPIPFAKVSAGHAKAFSQCLWGDGRTDGQVN